MNLLKKRKYTKRARQIPLYQRHSPPFSFISKGLLIPVASAQSPCACEVRQLAGGITKKPKTGRKKMHFSGTKR